MRIENTRFGVVEVDDGKIITMKRNLPGFPGRKRFVLLNREESAPFLWYQCIDDPPLAFVMINPFLLKPDYSVDLAPVLSDLSWEKDRKDHCALFVLVNASSGEPEKMTANLMAPLVINTNRFEAVQIIIQDSGYSHRHPLFSRSENAAEAEQKFTANGSKE